MSAPLKRPFVTGFCSMGNHAHCGCIIGNGSGRTIVCTCMCHASQIPDTPVILASADVHRYDHLVMDSQGQTLGSRIHEALVTSLRKRVTS